MKMTLREQEMLTNRITWGCNYTCIKDSNDRPIYLVIKELTLKDKSWVDFIYQQAISEGKAQKLLSMSELAIFLEKHNLWSARKNKELQELANGINRIESKLSDVDISKHEKKKILRAKQAVQAAYGELNLEKERLFSGTLEKYAEQQRVKAIVFCSAYTTTEDKLWPTWDAFENETDIRLVYAITEEIIKLRSITTEQFRYIARSGTWRFKWLASKNCDDLFGQPIVALTKSQENLIYWSQVYDSVYESIDRPGDDIINDDEALDRWFEEQTKKRSRKEVESGRSKKFKVSHSVARHGEVGIVTNEAMAGDMARAAKLGLAKKNQDLPTTQEVNDLNTPLSKKFLAAQRKKLEAHKYLKEEDIRANSNERRVIGSTDAIFKKQRRPDGFTGKAVTKTYQGGTLHGRRDSG